jgi:hypothetical protein
MDPRLALAIAALAILIALCLPTEAHCFSVWRYHVPQRCGFRAPQPRRIVASPTPPALRMEPSPGAFDLPMIDPDPATTALRERLEP